MPGSRRVVIGPGEEARVTPEGPTAAVIESRGELPLRVRSSVGSAGRLHAGSAVGLGGRLFEVVALDRRGGRCLYRLQPWPADQVARDHFSYAAASVEAALAARETEQRLRMLRPVAPLLEVLAALLPDPWRTSVAQGLALDATRGAVTGALACLLGGGVALLVGFIAASRARLDAVAGELSRTSSGAGALTMLDSFTAGGPWAYFLRPSSLLLAYLAVTGFVRFLHAWTTRQPAPDPALALLIGGTRALMGRHGNRAALARLGPDRPDRLLEQGRELLVLSSREKPEWNERSTIQVGDGFYRLGSRDERELEGARWIAYRLVPLEAGIVFRGLVRYEPPAAARRPRQVGSLETGAGASRQRSGEATATSAGPGPGAASEPATEPDAATDETPVAAGAALPAARPSVSRERTRWRLADGEEARLTPEGPHAARIESLGGLPLRPRSEAGGVHHRPEFPGTCVVLGGRRYEVVAEEARELGAAYGLAPWGLRHVLRDVVEYGPRLVRAAQRARRLAEERERGARRATWLQPLIGLLPETEQRVRCDRLGLDPVTATVGGAALEIVVALALLLTVPALGLPALLVFLSAIPRAVGALALGEIAGGVLGGVYTALRGLSAASAERADPSVLPLTREAFWQRLEAPDRRRPQPDGTLVIESLLPHLGWGATAAAGAPPCVRSGNDYWRVQALDPRVERGRLVHTYALWPLEQELAEGYAPAPPDPHHYRDEVLAEVESEWGDIFGVAPFLPGMLPRAAQERAYRRRGGPAAARGWSLSTALATGGLAAWFATGSGVFNLATAAVLLVDAGQRTVRAAAGDFAPSLFGGLVSDYLRPEREAYLAHLAAERDALARLRRAGA
ncbi:MAG: hypothetical protein AB7O37_05240 [Vicinamibacteria bacterium]